MKYLTLLIIATLIYIVSQAIMFYLQFLYLGNWGVPFTPGVSFLAGLLTFMYLVGLILIALIYAEDKVL